MAFYQFNQTLGYQFFREQVALVPAWHRVMKDAKLGDKAMRWLLAIYDIRSPYRDKYKEEGERIEAVNKDLFQRKRIDWQDDPIIEQAIDAFREHFYDEDMELSETYAIHIQRETQKLKDTRDSGDIKKIVATIGELKAAKAITDANLVQKIKSGIWDNITYKKGQKPSALTLYMEEKKVAEQNMMPT